MAYKGVFQQLIKEFFYDDISSCLTISKLKQNIPCEADFKGGLNFTSALVIMCVIEMMAGYYKGKVEPSVDDVADFLGKYFSNLEPLFREKEFSKQFFKVFRHGLAHEFSPKASAIDMNFSVSKVIYTIKPQNEELMCLNVPAFFDIAKKALGEYEKDLDKGNYTAEFNKRHSEVLKIDYKEMRKLRELLNLHKT